MKKWSQIGLLLFMIGFGCKEKQKKKINGEAHKEVTMEKKKVVYQVFTRLFGNTNETNKPWGTIEENGVGKFEDFTPAALKEIKDMGVTHIWYTGVPHHAVIQDYTAYGILNDDPDVVKGRAGSPYAVKDYYNVNPDLAVDPENRLQEFLDLIERTHKAGLKLIIDIVPNHVARNYKGANNPEGVEDFGFSDDPSKEYDRKNDFYYIPEHSFKVPEWKDGYSPLGGETNPVSDGMFKENPAKWTGNGARKAQPDFYDWYETVKVNYGIRPDGTKDFPILPKEYENKDYKAHLEFWKDKEVSGSWKKFRDIALYWIDHGVDGFRYDMSEMVPVEFWSYMNSAIKMKNKDAFLLAEIYNPAVYRDYIHKGKMDYLYDKVQLYDTLKHIMQGHGKTDNIPAIQESLIDIEENMLHFLENHDEQRIASPEFAGDAKKGKPAMVVSTTISSSPTLIYFGQEVGEPGAENAGFGKPSRTSIFDYIGVPHLQRWVNDKKFDGARLSNEEKDLRDFYSRLLNFAINSTALMGEYEEIHSVNRKKGNVYNDKLFSFARWSDSQKLIVLVNFDDKNSYTFSLEVPEGIIEKWQLDSGEYKMVDKLYGKNKTSLSIANGVGSLKITLKPLESLILQLENQMD